VYKTQYAALGARAGELEERLQVLEADKAALLDHAQASATRGGGRVERVDVAARKHTGHQEWG